MDFTFQMYWEPPGKPLEPFLSPLTLDLASIEIARELIRPVAEHRDVPVHSLTITSADGKIAERWFQLNGTWRRKDA